MTRLIQRTLWAGIWTSAIVAMAAFFLPWAKVDLRYREATGPVGAIVDATPLAGLVQGVSKRVGKIVVQVRRGAEVVTGELPDLSTIPEQIRGVDIPILANRQDVKTLLALAELVTDARQVGLKSYAVYLVPSLALLCALLVSLVRAPWVCFAAGGVCLTIAGVGFWKLLTLKPDTLLASLVLGPGLWWSCWAYAVLGGLALALGVVYNAFISRRDSSVGRAQV